MKNMLSTYAAFIWLLTAASSAIGQTSFAQLQEQAEAALVNGKPTETAASAKRMLALHPDSFPALFLLALAQSDLDDTQTAASTAALAYNVAPTKDTRLQAARLVASARFRAGQYTRSALWLRRAANHTTTTQDIEAVVREYVRATRANPLSMQFSGSIAPSDNINNGSDDGVLNFEGIPIDFVLPENERAVPGLEFAGSARATYRLSQNTQQTTTFNGVLTGQSYALSEQSKDLLGASPSADIRAIKGRDFATTVVEIGLTHRRPQLVPIGPTAFTVSFGTYWQGGDRLVNYQDFIVEQTIPTAPNAAFSARASVRDQQALQSSVTDSMIYDAIGAYRMGLANTDTLQFSLAWRQNDAGPQSTYREYRAGLGYSFAQPILNTRWSTSLGLEYRAYDTFPTTLDGRQDRVVTLGADAVFQDLTYFGFSPSMSFSATRRQSNAEEITSSAVQVQFGIQSNF